MKKDDSIDFVQDDYYEGLQTGLKPLEQSTKAPRGQKELESFLTKVEMELTSVVKRYDEKVAAIDVGSQQVHDILKELGKTSEVLVPTDKTNSFVLVEAENYVKWVKQHLSKNAKEISRSRVVYAHQKANQFVEGIAHRLSKKEHAYISESLNSKAIPVPKLLIKDHKKAKDGIFPTRLVVPATNFTAAIPNVGYRGIRNIFDKTGVNYKSKTIIQASHLKEQLESLNINKQQDTIFSLDIEAMYPSVKFKVVKRAVEYYAQELASNDKEVITDCLKMIGFGMNNTLISFQDKYYEYDGGRNLNNKGLTIGGYESAWLADLVAAFILDNTEDCFKESRFCGIYRDDGLVVLKGNQGENEIIEWLNFFQRRVNEVTEDDGIIFTASIWGADKKSLNSESSNPRVEVVSSDYFPYLDMKMTWDTKGDLNFGVYLKPGQRLKYLNKGSEHPTHCFNAINTGVFGRLAKLTTVTEENKFDSLQKIYPEHFKALDKANLLPRKIPTLNECIASTLDRERVKEIKQDKQRQRNRTVFFCIGYSSIWKKPIHKILKDIRNEFEGLKWLKISMSYHRFPNVREIISGDLSNKILEDVESLDFKTLECNCRGGSCNYNNICRAPIIVYEVKCKITDKVYIGNTQQHFKKRMQQHFGEMKNLFCKEIPSDSYAKHFASVWPHNSDPPTPEQQRKLISCKMLWQGNPLKVVKTFHTKNCILCSQERLAILKQKWKDKTKLINANSEIYGSCRHNPHFHRYYRQNQASTDEHLSAKKSSLPIPRKNQVERFRERALIPDGGLSSLFLRTASV